MAVRLSTRYPAASNTGAASALMPGTAASTACAMPAARMASRSRSNAASKGVSGSLARTAARGSQAANNLPEAVPRRLMTVPWRMPTCTWAGPSSVRTMVAPRLPHTAMPTVCPTACASAGNCAVAMRTGSLCCRLMRPSCIDSGPSP